MNIKKFLEDVCNEIKYKPVREEIVKEIETHIVEIKENYIEMGVEENEAEENAVYQMGDAKSVGKELNKIHKPQMDWKLLILIFILIGFNCIIKISKEANILNGINGYLIIGSLVSVGIYLCDYRIMQKKSMVIYLLVTMIMTLPLLGISEFINGTCYLKIGEITIEPVTLAIPLYIIAFSGMIIDCNKKRDCAKMGMLALVSILLIITISGLKDAILLAVVYIIIITEEIIRKKNKVAKQLGILYGSVFIGIVLIAQTNLVNFKRIIVSFYPEIDVEGMGYVGMAQKDIMEKSKSIGETESASFSNNNMAVNKKDNYAFIYVIGKMGKVVAGILILIISLVALKLVYNVNIINERYGKNLTIGLGSLYIIQSFASILMNVNLGIQTNINIPFVAGDDMYFMINCISMSIVLSIFRKKNIILSKE